jgi:hypothetical protein
MGFCDTTSQKATWTNDLSYHSSSIIISAKNAQKGIPGWHNEVTIPGHNFYNLLLRTTNQTGLCRESILFSNRWPPSGQPDAGPIAPFLAHQQDMHVQTGLFATIAIFMNVWVSPPF